MKVDKHSTLIKKLLSTVIPDLPATKYFRLETVNRCRRPEAKEKLHVHAFCSVQGRRRYLAACDLA